MYTERNDSLDDLLNDCYGEIVICGCTFTAADILARLDPIAYDQALADSGLLDEEDEEEEDDTEE